MLSPEHDGIIICGKRKRGKTTLTKELYANEKRVVIYDAKGELKEPVKLQQGRHNPIIWQERGILRVYVERNNQPWEELEWSAYIATLMTRCVYVVDELPDALEDADPGPHWKWVTRMGRKRDIRFIYTFQRAFEVPVMARAQAADWYLLQTNEASDVDYIRRSVSREGADIVRQLKTGQALHVRDGEVVGIVSTTKPQST